jgi:predicted TPR repeat methyltransferase
MTKSRQEIDQKARAFFEELWERGDYWNLETSAYERAKYERQMELLRPRHYRRALEIGCGSGCFTRRLADIADHVLAMDISAAAIARARAASPVTRAIEYRAANIMECDLRAEGAWDLIVMSETICYLGWLYSFFDVAWLASEIFNATQNQGRFIMANTYGAGEYLLSPWIIRTYKDLFVNVGYRLETDEIFTGTKNGADLEVLISVFLKPGEPQEGSA